MMYSLLLFFSFFSIAFGRIDSNAQENEGNSVRNYYERVERRNLTGACEDCKLVAAELKNVLDDQTKMERIKIALKFLCDYIGGERAQECKNIVNNLDVIIHQLQPYLDDPEKFCEEIHLCTAGRKTTTAKLFLHVAKFMLRASKQNDVNDLLCDECVFAATELNSLLQNQQVQQEMRKELEGICDSFESLKQRCEDFIAEFYPMALEYLIKLVSDPQKFCAELQVCRSVYFQSLRNFDAAAETPRRYGRLNGLASGLKILQTRFGNNVVCSMCLAEAKVIKEKLERNEVRLAAKIGRMICDLAPAELQTGCLDFMNIYAVAILNMTLDQITPRQFCTDAGLCSFTEVENFEQLSQKQKSDTICEACRTFADFLSYEFRQPPLQHEMTTLVKNYVCKKLPGDLANQCLDTADQYVPSIMQRLADTISAPSFCIEVGMCST